LSGIARLSLWDLQTVNQGAENKKPAGSFNATPQVVRLDG
jgi:hypothetical protein